MTRLLKMVEKLTLMKIIENYLLYFEIVNHIII
jgi:hypothetical protein